MCGILGTINQKITPDALESIHHRGPDFQDTYDWKNISFGHTRLSIVDLSEAGNQPMRTINDDFAIIFNGEIYNHQELRKGLKIRQFKGYSDTETILYDLQENGIEAVRKFNGIFAFALLDKKQNKLFLVRDPFGVKPLYYYKIDGEIQSFSSEIKPLFALGAKKEFNDDQLPTFLKLRYVPSPNTLFKNVYKVEPGTILEIDGETGKILKSTSFQNVPKETIKISTEEALDEYDNLLKKAVKRQLMADMPVSLLLSGGVDSALLAKLIKEETGESLKTYTAGYDLADNSINELEDAQKTAQWLDLENEVVILSEDGFLKSLPQLIDAVEEPLGSGSIYPINFLAKKINEDGYKVTLTGQGVDEPWGGYRRYNTQQTLEGLGKMPIPFLKQMGATFKNDSIRRGINTLNAKNRAGRFMESYSLFDDQMLQDILNPWFKKDNNTQTLIAEKLKALGLEDKTAISAMMNLDARMNLSDDLLLYTDKISMQHSLETRVPFLDLDLMAFAESLPHHLKVGLFKNKWLHKKLAERHLPKEIIYRKKRGFYTPQKLWFKGEIGDKLEDMLTTDNQLFSQYFNKEEIKRYFRLHRTGKVNYEKQLYLLVSLFFWMKNNFS